MATNVVTPIDPETISMEDLRRLAEEEARKATTQPNQPAVKEEVVEPKKEEEVKQPEVTTTPKVFYAERSIDLGDGAGVQVFRGKGASREDALEQALDKLADAQRNATKKIREQAARLKAQEGPTKEEESLLAAEIVTNPSKVVKNILGIDPSDLKEVVAEAKQTRANKQKRAVGDEFVSKHPEFLDNERNGQRLFKAVTLFGEFTLENLEKAYQDLNESGLLEVKGEEAGHGQEEEKSETRIEQQAVVNPPRVTKKASGVSTHSKTVVPQSAEPSEDELYSMPLDEVRRRANKQLAGN